MPPENRLRIARQAAGFQNAHQAADQFGWTYRNYMRHEKGELGFTKHAATYAEAFGVSEAWLLTGEGQGPLGLTNGNGVKGRTKQKDQSSEDEPRIIPPTDLVMVPVFDVRASAGGGAFNETENQIGVWPFERQYLASELRIRPSDLAIIEVVGDSMEPKLQSGDRAVIDQHDTNISNPGIFLIHDGHGLVIKRIERIFNTDPVQVRLISDNPAHSPYDVTAEQVQIIGRVRLKIGLV